MAIKCKDANLAVLFFGDLFLLYVINASSCPGGSLSRATSFVQHFGREENGSGWTAFGGSVISFSSFFQI